MQPEFLNLLIKRFFLIRKNNIHNLHWFANFKQRRRGTDDAEDYGHLNSSIATKNMNKVHENVLRNRKAKFA